MKNITLGPLEQEIMSRVWNKKTCTTRDIVECISKNKKIAYNTVQTVMTRLVNKGLLNRKLKGKTHIYKPATKQKNVLSSMISQIMNGFTNKFGEEALLAFVDNLDDISNETRQKLIKKLQKK